MCTSIICVSVYASIMLFISYIPQDISCHFPLQQVPPIGMDTPLVDAEGYPRADIDVLRARTLRKRFKEIQTDHKVLEKKIERGLVEIAALSNGSEGQVSNSTTGSGSKGISSTTAEQDEEEKKARLSPKPKPKFDPKTGKWVVKSWDGSVAGVEDGETRTFNDLTATSTAALASNISGGGGRGSGATNGQDEGANNITGGNSTTQQQRQQQVSFQQHATIPFAIIDEVTPNSPASEAGLCENDLILQFGHVNSTNHREFREVAELLPLAASENKTITVAVRRTTMELGGVVEVIKTEVVQLRPRTWAGRGLLGCHIKPYTD